MTTADFKKGDRVLYIPNQANGVKSHPDCEHGVVSSANEVNVFVRYYNRHGNLAHGGQATSPENLQKTS